MSIQTIGVIGAGTMGNGIAQSCAVSGLDVVMIDIDEAAVARGLVDVEQYADSQYRPCPLLTEMVAASWLGRKTGRGVYRC